MVETPDVVVPMEDLPDPMSINFLYKATNVSGAPVYVTAQLVTPPAGWADYAERQCGSLAIGQDDYFIFDTPTRTKPATNTTEVVTLRVTYYSDAGYSAELNHEDIAYTYTYVDFDDVSYTTVDEDTFEIDLEGWTKTDEVGSTVIERSVTVSRTGVGSMQHLSFTDGEVAYVKKSFTIGAVTRAFIRIWMYAYIKKDAASPYNEGEYIIELITDAGGVNERILPIAMDSAAKCGGEICMQWLCVGAKIPVDGTFEVRLRPLCEYSGEESSPYGSIHYDDIKVIQS